MHKKVINVLIVAHYFPPINSSGAKRFQFISKYLAQDGFNITVVTTQKTSSDGEFSEDMPLNVNVIELDQFGKYAESKVTQESFVPLYSDKPSLKRKIKDLVMILLGQLPDPRLPFAFSFLKKKLDDKLAKAIISSDIVIATSPPWSMLLVGIFIKKRFGIPCILDYRDHFSYCHEMPGNFIAKKVEWLVDRWLTNNSDHIVTISNPMKMYYSNFNKEVSVIANGYDFESMELARKKAFLDRSSKNIFIRYMGIVSDGRIPKNFIKALSKLENVDKKKFDCIKIQFYGNASLLKKFLEKYYPSLLNSFDYFDFVSYDESLKLMIESDYVLFSETSLRESLSSQGILTTKLFEYLGSGRPIIGDIAPSTLPGELILQSSDRNIVSNNMTDFLNMLLEDNFYIKKEDSVSDIALSFTRQGQAKNYAKLIKGVLNDIK